jgi:dTDP-4-amino-4,6-dideoxygalactose transaminase
VTSKLAIDGGTPVRTKPFPTSGDASGRTLGDEEIALVTEVLRSGKLFRFGGKFVPRLEEEFAKLHGVRHALACTSGTASIHIAVAAVNPDPGDEIITSPISDIGSVAPILFQNAIPVFADLEPDTYTLDPQSVEERATDRTRAILVVHLLGQPTDMDGIMEIARRRGLAVIEDCCQAYLAEHKGKLVGTIGDMGCFSLQQSKHITTGDGGICITDNDELGSRARLFADKGWPREGPVRDYQFLGANYRMNELTGAVACAQLGKVERSVSRRRALAQRLTEQIENVEGVNPPAVREGCKHSYWFYPITVEEEVIGMSPHEFARALSAEGIPASAGYIGRPLYLSPVLREKRTYGASHCPYDCGRGRDIEYKEGYCPQAEAILKRMILVGWNENYSEGDVADIAEALAKVAKTRPIRRAQGKPIRRAQGRPIRRAQAKPIRRAPFGSAQGKQGKCS